MSAGADSYHKPTRSESDNLPIESLDDLGLSDSLRDAIEKHHGWINLRPERSPTSDDNLVIALNAKIIAALLNDRATIVSVNDAAAVVSPEVIAALAAGSITSVPNTESYSPTVSEPFMNQLDKNSATRLRALRQRLSELPSDGPAPAIKLLLKLPGLWQRDQIVVECPLLAWEPKPFPTEFTVDLGDSPLIAPSFRNERAVVMTWSLLDWREE